MDTVLRDEGFQVALAVATIGFVLAWWATRRGRVVGAGLVAVVATLVALWDVYSLSARLVIGLALLGGAWLIGRFAPQAWGVAVALGAFLVVGNLDGVPRWMQVAGFVAIVVAAPASVALDRVVPRWMPLLALVSAVGIYDCAPDTEVTKLVLGALAPVAFLVFVPRLQSSTATASLAGLVVWLAVLEGRGRPGAVVGSIACLGVIVLAPLVGWRVSSLRPTLLLLATHAGLVLYASRVAGLRDSAWVALALCVPAVVVATTVLAFVHRRVPG